MITLPIKRKWFDMILSGKKREEYRRICPHYDSLFCKYEGQKITIRLRNGYSGNSPAALCEIVPHRGLTGTPKWGAEPGEKYWVLEILNIEEEKQNERKMRGSDAA